MSRPLPLAFYTRTDVVAIARDLLGKVLLTRLDGVLTGGVIVETEAYAGPHDRASHAFGNRRTPRTEVMFARGGVAYVYLCYGLHHLFNIITHDADVPHAVLVRALEPTVGVAHMLRRRGKARLDATLCGGPGSLAQALGIRVAHSGVSLLGKTIWLEDRGRQVAAEDIVASPRVGVDYAGPDAALPYRFRVKGSPWCSRAK